MNNQFTNHTNTPPTPTPSADIPTPPQASTNELYDEDSINIDDIRQEYSEEQARLQRSMRRVRYWTGVLVMLTAVFLGYVMWYRPEASAIENKKTQVDTLQSDVNKLQLELKKSQAVATYFAPITAYHNQLGSGTTIDTNDAPTELLCLDLIQNAYIPPKITTPSGTGDSTTTTDDVNADDTDIDNETYRKCEPLLKDNKLTFAALRAAYLIQDSGKTQTYFDMQRTLKYIDTILLGRKTYDTSETKKGYYDRVTSITFGDVTPAQDHPMLEVLPITIELSFENEAEAIDFARKVESRVVNDTTLHHLYMIDDMTFDIAQHDDPQEISINLSLYLYNTSATPA